MAFSKFFNSVEPLFKKNGKYEKFYPIFEMVETIFYTSNTVTKAAPHATKLCRYEKNNDICSHFFNSMYFMGIL